MTEANSLAEMNCAPCHEGGEALADVKAYALLRRVEGWELLESERLRKSYDFADFRSAADFVDRVADLAEQQGHHPDVHLTWGRVDVESYTHKVGGLTENDFILAAKIDRLYERGA